LNTSYAFLVEAADGGDPAAATALFVSLYDELHRLARRELTRRGHRPSLGATTLLHEAYLDLSQRDGATFPDRGRFMAYAARVMRGLIVDHGRRRLAVKRGGRFELITLDTDAGHGGCADGAALTSVSEAIEALAAVDPALAEVVDLKFFCGFSLVEIAGMRGVSERTVQRQWEKARIYLFHMLRDMSRT
jgi:RNA polymerase sigma factor (TIGR02999 family)